MGGIWLTTEVFQIQHVWQLRDGSNLQGIGRIWKVPLICVASALHKRVQESSSSHNFLHEVLAEHFVDTTFESSHLPPEEAALVQVVTICSKHFEGQVMAFLQKENRLILEESVPFDNKGWTQCKLYITRKPLDAASEVVAGMGTDVFCMAMAES
eukprot:symbB.v1.2.036836.t1/scaffold5293.1/size28761/4